MYSRREKVENKYNPKRELANKISSGAAGIFNKHIKPGWGLMFVDTSHTE